MTPTEYMHFVRSRVCPTSHLSDFDFECLHCALGLAAEYLELIEALDGESYLEELGDYYFYLTYLWELLHRDRGLELAFVPIEVEGGLVTTGHLGQNTEILVTQVKKYCIYKQNIPRFVEDLKERVILTGSSYISLLKQLSEYGPEINTSLIVESNVSKLTRRYKEKFTVTESVERNDENE